MNKMSKFKLIIAALVLLSACKSETESILPLKKDINEAVYAAGNIYPAKEYKVFSNADGNVLELLVEEGDTVALNQILMRVDRDVQMARAEGSEQIYNIANKNISTNSPVLIEYEAALQTIALKFKNDSTNYTRYQNLYKQEATSKVELERAQLNYFASKNEYYAKKKGLERLKNQLKVEFENAQTQYKLNAKDADNYVLKSMMNGRVYELLKEQGEMVRRNEAVALIGDLGTPMVRLTVDELDLPKIKIGQEVFIHIDMFNDRIFKAKVSKIYPKLNRLDQSFRVDAIFMDTDIPNLYGLSLEANIMVSEKKNALCIPKTFLVSKDSLWLDVDGEKSLRKIKTGISDFDFVEITEGITEQSIIYKP
jgi:multidrug efflux pump subunit AcrA (membrane-fusion protein)